MTKHLANLCAIVILLASSASPQLATSTTTTQTSDPQAVELANQAQLAITGGTPVSDVLLNGNAEWIAGGTRASGNAMLKQKGTAEARLDIAAGSYSRSEIRNDSNGSAGAWGGGDGVQHALSPHNCWAPAAWFAPNAVIQALFSTGTVVSYAGRETRNGLRVDHLHAYRNYRTSNPQLAKDIQALSSFDMYLDPASHMPVAVVFSIHPDNDSSRNIPVEIRFANYQRVSGILVPFRIQRLIQGSLNLDVTITSAAINGGIADSEFAVQ